ncbi:MAG: YCF48-related protein [bacterium]
MKSKTVILIVIISMFLSCENNSEFEYYHYSWEKQVSNTTLTLNDIAFTDSLTGWVCGEYGILLTTTDAGLTWIQKDDLLNKTNLNKIFFTEPEIGFVLGDYEAYKTSDGGDTWISIFVRDSSINLFDMQFLNSKTGWICSMDIYKTTNGGDNWEIVTPKKDSSIIIVWLSYFVDEFNGFGFCRVFDTTENMSDSYLAEMRTIDGGENWEFINKDYWTSLFGPTQYYFVSPQIGFKVFDFRNIEKTTNSGDEWLSIYNNVPFSLHDHGTSLYRPFKLIYHNNENLIITGNDMSYTKKYIGYISRSTNLGESWKSYQTGMYGKINSGYFINDNTGWLVGDQGLILKTTNGGKYYFD